MSQDQAATRRRYLELPLIAAVAGLAGSLFAAPAVLAQAAPGQGTPNLSSLIGDGDQMPNVHWFKICDTIQIVKSGVANDVNICRVHHRALDATTGNLLASVTIARVEGRENEVLSMTVPLGTAIKAGIRVKIDEDKNPLALEYSQCAPLGCQGETEMTPEFLAKLKKGKLMFVAVVGADGKALGIPVPLTGFSKVYDGEPMEMKRFAEVQNARQKAILDRQAELQKRAGQEKAVPAPAAAAPEAPAPAPVKPKRLE